MKSKAIGLRIPVSLWEQVSSYGYKNFPKSDNEDEKDFDITSTLLDLISRGLGIDSVEQPDKQTVEQIVKEIVQQNAQQSVLQTDEQSVLQVVEQRLKESNFVTKQNLDEINRAIATQLSSQLDSKIAAATKPLITEIKQLKKNSPLLRTSLA